MKIKPTKNVLQSWIECYVPEKDLFFLSKEHLKHGIDLTDVLLMPKEEFYNHSTYNQLKYVNSYEYWNIKNEQYVIVAEKEWIESISKEERKLILGLQVQCERGLVLPVRFIKDIEKIPSVYIQNGNVIIQRLMWEELEESFKEQLLLKVVYEWWDKGDCEQPPKSLPSFLKPYANTFSHHQGANCLASVLFAISKGKQKWFINEWIHQQTFLEKMNQYHYKEFLGEGIDQGDIVIWKDENSIIQHAAYHIGDELYFNKHGQTMFNPWKILHKEQLYKTWEHLTPMKYRQYK